MVQRSTLEMASRWDSSVASSESSTTSSKHSDSHSGGQLAKTSASPTRLCTYTRRRTTSLCSRQLGRLSSRPRATEFLNRLAFASDPNPTSHYMYMTPGEEKKRVVPAKRPVGWDYASRNNPPMHVPSRYISVASMWLCKSGTGAMDQLRPHPTQGAIQAQTSPGSRTPGKIPRTAGRVLPSLALS